MSLLEEPALTSRSQRIFKRNLLKRIEEEVMAMSSKRKTIEQTLVNETQEMSSQIVQLHRSEQDGMMLEHFHQRETLVRLCPDYSPDELREKNNNFDDLVKNILVRTYDHFSKYKEHHNEHCIQWFHGTWKWPCLLPLNETDGYFDETFDKCKYRNKYLED